MTFATPTTGQAAPEPLPAHTRRRATHQRPRPSVGMVLLGFVGELLITAGLFVGLFVVWQVYYTDIIGQREAAGHIETVLKDYAPVPDAVAPERREPPPPPPPPEVGDGDVGLLYVPRWGDDYVMPIGEGVGPSIIDEGYVGHYPTTEMPGENGNFALAGHRQTRGAPFRSVEKLEVGDPIIVQTKDYFYVYRMTSHRIVRPDQSEVIASNPFDPGAAATESVLTMTTCHPLWSIAERWIVHAELDYWTKASDGRPADLPEGTN